jgi:CRISPR-associated protein Cmr2
LDELWADAHSQVRGKIDDELAQKQINDLLEFYWVSVPYTGSYSDARDTVEYLFAARKATRNFDQVVGNSVPKSSLDGARETVIPKEKYPARNDPSADQKIKSLYRQYHARRGEQLSGVDILKRLGNPKDSPKFKSTSDMAAIPFIEQIKDGKGKELVDALIALLSDDRDILDESAEGLVFERRFEDAFSLQQITDEVRQEYDRLLKEYSDGAQPNPYYALLAADGDNMGVVIDAQSDLQKHRELSKALSEFATEVPKLVKAEKGVYIYTGGDDVLAYLPMHTALQCAQKLEAAFRSKMVNFTTTENGKTIAPTLSVGIAVVHHLEPLSDALNLVRQAERDAKSVQGKNGLAVVLSKRGGTDRPIVGQFQLLFNRLETLVKFSREDAISGGAAYELQELHRTISKTNIPSEGRLQEAIRIIARKREAGSDEAIKREIKDAFKDWLNIVDLDELAREMIVAKALAGKEEAK